MMSTLETLRRETVKLSDELLSVPGLCRIGLERTCYATNTIFVWIAFTRPPTLAEVFALRTAWRRRPEGYKYFINVDANNPVTMRFAALFDFYEVHRVGPISVQQVI